MADTQRFEMRVSKEWLAMLDVARGSETRGGFVKRVLEGALGGYEPVPESARVVPLVQGALGVVPAARVTSASRVVSVSATALSVPEGTPPLDASADLDPDARRRAAGLPPLRRGSPSPSLGRFGGES